MKNFKLENEPKITSGFSIPERYFDTLEDKVNSKLKNPEPKVISLFNNRKKWLYVTAACLVTMISIPIATDYIKNNSTTSEETFEDYITYNSSITEDDLVEALDKEDIEQMKINYDLSDNEIEEVITKNNNLEDYLIN